MYKSSSKNMIHATRVDQIDPTKGFIDQITGAPIEGFSLNAMSREELNAERQRNAQDLARFQNEMVIAKRDGSERAIIEIGLKIQTVCNRNGAIKARLREMSPLHGEGLKKAIYEIIADEDLRLAIFNRARQIDSGE